MPNEVQAGVAPSPESKHNRQADVCRDFQSSRLRAFGGALAAIGLALMGTGQLVFALPIADLQPLALPSWGARISGLVLATCALLMLVRRDGPASRAMALIWALLAGFALNQLLSGQFRILPAWVPFAEAMIVMSWALTGPSGRGFYRDSRLLRLSVGLALLLFGAVHLLHRDAIAAMIPPWLPWADYWPLATGCAQLAAGLAILSGLATAAGATVVGAMYLSWLPLVHLPRLMEKPSGFAEWVFAAMALVLAGCVFTLAGASAKIWERERTA